ncbi:hypothetical protein RF55_4987 [Lasius niger]|uniref:Uncharacterized protein n=1 Tax=Lasius niger TaxID=67767 RepID=A0A0J7KWC7_LASNI|nr:hypothetical protein RF55_4987 [Lasius niger]
MFPVERPSMLNTIARRAMGQNIPERSLSLMNLLDEALLNRIAENAGKRLWKGFMKFGSASAGVLGLFVAIRLIKLIIDMLIHGYALHSVYGWSLHLLGVIWTSVTNVLLHLREPVEKRVSNKRELLPLNSPPTTKDQLPEALPPADDKPPANNPASEIKRDYSELRKLLEEV